MPNFCPFKDLGFVPGFIVAVNDSPNAFTYCYAAAARSLITTPKATALQNTIREAKILELARLLIVSM